MVNKLIIAKNVKQAISCIKEGMSPLAGGTEVNRLDSCVKAKDFVYIGKIAELKEIEKTALEGLDSNYIKIGAACTYQDAIESALVPEYLKTACHFMASRVRRNMATLCGGIATRRDDSYIIAVLLATGAKLSVVSKFGRKSVIALSDYVFKKEKYGAYFITALLVNADVSKVAQKRYANTASSHGYITMAASKSGSKVQFGLCVKNSGVYAFDGEEKADIILKDDIFGSRAYKKYLIDITKEELTSALQGEKTKKRVSGGAK